MYLIKYIILLINKIQSCTHIMFWKKVTHHKYLITDLFHYYLTSQKYLRKLIWRNGFMPARSTVTNLVCVKQFLSGNTGSNGQIGVIYTDLW